jgi:hypothetical protein
MRIARIKPSRLLEKIQNRPIDFYIDDDSAAPLTAEISRIARGSSGLLARCGLMPAMSASTYLGGER